MAKERYKGNLGAFTQEELDSVRKKAVCVIGCGGLGGYVCQGLARFGVGALTLVDGDCFCESNLNRQLFARADTLGRNKAAVCAQELSQIDQSLGLRPMGEMLTEENAAELLAGHDLVVDCVDNHRSKILLEDACERLGLTLIHGAIGGFYGHVATVPPGGGLMKKLYAQWTEEEAKRSKVSGSPVFAVQAIAALQCAEAIKCLAGRPTLPPGVLLHLNVMDNELHKVKT